MIKQIILRKGEKNNYRCEENKEEAIKQFYKQFFNKSENEIQERDEVMLNEYYDVILVKNIPHGLVYNNYSDYDYIYSKIV